MPKEYTPKSNNSTGGKDRWTESDRRKRDERGATRGERPARPATGDHRPARPYQDRPARGERPDWSPRPPQNSARPQRDGAARPQRDGADRPARDGAPRREWQPREGQAPRREWNDRPARDSADRPARPYQDRPARPYQDRPARPHQDRPYQDRPARDGQDRPARPYQDRQDRPARPYQDRPDRPARPYQDRPARGERPDWTPREARPARTDGYNSDRPRTDDRAPRREWNDRPAHTDRTDRTERPRFEDRGQRDDRAPRPIVEDVVLDRLDAKATAADAGTGMTFGDLGLGDNIVRQLAAMGAAEPFPIQAATIPEVLVGRDVLGRGRTGSGKTIAFGAPIVERLLQLHRDGAPSGAKGRSMGRKPRAIILAPTRELAQQIDRTVQPLARSVGLFTISIVGGVPYQRQLTGLQRGVDIVIGTPGRIQDLVDKRELDLSQIAISVLDEADHMCDLGFLEPVQELLRQTPEGSQRLLFSATLDRAVESLVAEFLDNPSVHEVEGEDQASSTISHRVLVIDNHTKREVLKELVGDTGRAIVFSRTRVFADEIANLLDDAGIAAVSMHGDLNQAKRNRSLAALSGGRVRALVATDVAARGIHVDDVELVVQADMPDDHKTYMHRSGRTGRAGAHGTVITVIPAARRRRMEELLELAGIEAEWEDRSTPRPPRADGGARGPWRERGDRPARPRY